jgi:hypothetical protein
MKNNDAGEFLGPDAIERRSFEIIAEELRVRCGIKVPVPAPRTPSGRLNLPHTMIPNPCFTRKNDHEPHE